MLRLFVLVAGLAAFGAYKAVDSVTAGLASSVASLESSGESANFLESKALTMALDLAGLKLIELPSEGCSESAIPADRVLELVNALPAEQRVIFAQLMDSSATVWSAQLYSGSHGIGLCLPVQSKLLILPGLSGLNIASTLEHVYLNSP